MGLEFDDGTSLDCEDLDQAKRLLATRAIVHGQLPKLLDLDGVVIRLENLQVRRQPSIPLIVEDYTEESHNGWIIRVAPMGTGFGVNYFKPDENNTLRFQFVPGEAAPPPEVATAQGIASAASNLLGEIITEREVFLFIKNKIDKGTP